MWLWNSFTANSGLSTIHGKHCVKLCIAADKLCKNPLKKLQSTFSQKLMLFSKRNGVQASVCSQAMLIKWLKNLVYIGLPHLWISKQYWPKTWNFALYGLLKKHVQKWILTSASAILSEYPPLHTANNNNQYF